MQKLIRYYNLLMQMCFDGQLLMIGHHAQPLLTLHHAFLPEKVLRRLQESLFRRWPLLDAAELAEGYNAISIDMNMEGDHSMPSRMLQQHLCHVPAPL